MQPRILPVDEISALEARFIRAHGDREDGWISEEDYDRLFDHLAVVLARFGSFSDQTGSNPDFSGSRYVDLLPWIVIVTADEVAPQTCVAAAREAIATAHRPLAVCFDMWPKYLAVFPNAVYSTFEFLLPE